MISQEQFVKRTLDAFDDIRREIADIREDYSSLHEKITVHLKVESKLEEYKDKLDRKKNKKFYVIIAVMSIGFTAWQVIDKIFL